MAEGPGRARRLGAVLLGAGLAACGTPAQPPPLSYEQLLPLAPVLAAVGTPFRQKMVGGGGGVAPVVALVDGQLPDGLAVQDDGIVAGVPDHPGEWQRFTLEAHTPDGDALGQQSYAIAVGASTTNLPASPTVAQTGDALAFSGDWGRPIAQAFAFDPAWNLLWPLRAGAGVSGGALASESGALILVAAGPGAQGVFDIASQPSDPRIGVVAELTWEGDADLDLRWLVDPALGGAEVNAQAPSFDTGGKWQAKLELSASSAPGPEVAVLAKEAPAGRYALMVTKAGGGDVKLPAWLSLRQRDGTVLAEARFDLLLSDTAGASLADDIAHDRQSYGALGLVTVGADGEVAYSPAPSARDPFAKAPEGP